MHATAEAKITSDILWPAAISEGSTTTALLIARVRPSHHPTNPYHLHTRRHHTMPHCIICSSSLSTGANLGSQMEDCGSVSSTLPHRLSPRISAYATSAVSPKEQMIGPIILWAAFHRFYVADGENNNSMRLKTLANGCCCIAFYDL